MKKRFTAMITLIALVMLGTFTMNAEETYTGTPYGGTAQVISATEATVVEAENFDEGGTGVAHNIDEDKYSDASYRTRGIGSYKGFTLNTNQWFKYTVNAEKAGYYKTVFNGGTFSVTKINVYVNDVKYVQDKELAEKNPKDNYTSISNKLGYIYLKKGTNRIKVECSFNWCYFDKLTLSDPADHAPYKDNKISASETTKIEFENYDIGGEGVAYHSTRTTLAGSYRTDEYVVIAGLTGATGVSFQTNEWMKYTLEVEEDGNYQLDINACVLNNTNRALSVYVNDNLVINNKLLTAVGTAANDYTPRMNEKFGYVTLKKGKNVIKFANPGAFFYPDYFALTKLTETVPYDEMLVFLGDADFKIEAVNFDIGGKGVAYDSTRTDAATEVRTGEYVGISNLDTGKSLNTVDGEWFKYTFNAMGGIYNMNLDAVVLDGDAVVNVYVNDEKLISEKKLGKFAEKGYTPIAYDLGTLKLDVGTNTIKIERVSGNSLYLKSFSFAQAHNSIAFAKGDNGYTVTGTVVNLGEEAATSYIIAAAYVGNKLESIDVTPVTILGEDYKTDTATVAATDSTTKVKAFVWSTVSGTDDPLSETIEIKTAE